MTALLDYTDQTIIHLQAARQHAVDQFLLRARQAVSYDEFDAVATVTDVRDMSALLEDLMTFSYAEEQAEFDRRIAAARARHPETGLWPEPAYTCDTCGEHFFTAWDADFHEESSTHSVWYTAIAELEVGPPASRW